MLASTALMVGSANAACRSAAQAEFEHIGKEPWQSRFDGYLIDEG
jgi:hypothetical protein